MSTRVYLSYAKGDATTAHAVAKRLEEKYGVHTWLDDVDIKSGDSIVKRLLEAISESSAVIAILSERSTESPWLLFEIGAAFGMGKPVVTMVIGESNRGDFPDWLRTVRNIDARDRTLQQAVEELSEHLGKREVG